MVSGWQVDQIEPVLVEAAVVVMVVVVLGAALVVMVGAAVVLVVAVGARVLVVVVVVMAVAAVQILPDEVSNIPRLFAVEAFHAPQRVWANFNAWWNMPTRTCSPVTSLSGMYPG